MKTFFAFFYIISFGLLTTTACKSKEPIQENILFIGNSYTYRNCGVDCHLRRLIENDYELSNTTIERAAQGKYHLSTHYNDPDTKAKFESKKWDKVILQEYSSGPIADSSNFFKYANLWKQKVRKTNTKAKIYLYSTWGYKKVKEMTSALDKQYKKLSKSLHSKQVPVGLLWKEIETDINLYDGDGAHPNRKGTFVTACLFYEYLFKKDVTKTLNSDQMLSKEMQKKLKKLAHDFIRKSKAY